MRRKSKDRGERRGDVEGENEGHKNKERKDRKQ
jgi:hypothetical protein